MQRKGWKKVSTYTATGSKISYWLKERPKMPKPTQEPPKRK